MNITPLEHWIMQKAGLSERDGKALEEYQLNKIKETISYAKENSIFYREHLANIHEDKIHSFDDFQDIPFTFSYHIGKNPHDFLCVPQRDVKRIITINSSGTSGNGKRIFFTEEDLELTVDFFKYGFQPMLNGNDRVLVLFPGNSYGSVGDVIKRALDLINVESFVKGVLINPEEAARFIVENNINSIVGIPMQVLYFSRIQNEVFRSKIDKVLLSADYVPEVLIREFDDKYGCKVFTHYGTSEMGYGGGVECGALEGYHVREADLYFEIINPDTGKAVEDGQYGEIVFTTLTRQAMPLIRYRIGDIASFSSKECSCGTFLRTMKRALGRMDNRIALAENQYIYLRELDEIVLSFEEVLDYQSHLDSGDILVLEIMAQGNEHFGSIKDKIRKAVHEYFYKKFGHQINIEIIPKFENEALKITNSMVKRKIYDNR